MALKKWMAKHEKKAKTGGMAKVDAIENDKSMSAFQKYKIGEGKITEGMGKAKVADNAKPAVAKAGGAAEKFVRARDKKLVDGSAAGAAKGVLADAGAEGPGDGDADDRPLAKKKRPYMSVDV